MPHLEIEKRYLIRTVDIESILENDFIEFTKSKLEQFYLLATVEKTERYRKEGNFYIRNCKKGSGLVREEREEQITKKEYKAAKKRNSGGVIKKVRYKFKINDNLFELDLFKGPLKGMHILEVEFENIEDANRFRMPQLLESLIIKEITNEALYSNGALSQSMKIPLRADSLLSLNSIIQSRSIKEPYFDIYISKYENMELALNNTLYRLFLSFRYQLQNFIQSEESTCLQDAAKALNRYKSLLKSFKKYIHNESYEKKLFSIDTFLLLFDESIKLHKSFVALLECKSRYDLEKQNKVLKTLIALAKEKKRAKERLLQYNLTKEVENFNSIEIHYKKKLEKPFEYIIQKVLSKKRKKVRKTLKSFADDTKSFLELKEYKHLMQFAQEKFHIKEYAHLKKLLYFSSYIQLLKKQNPIVSLLFEEYCMVKVNMNSTLKKILKGL